MVLFYMFFIVNNKKTSNVLVHLEILSDLPTLSVVLSSKPMLLYVFL